MARETSNTAESARPRRGRQARRPQRRDGTRTPGGENVARPQHTCAAAVWAATGTVRTKTRQVVARC